jgi:hypothetical protein
MAGISVASEGPNGDWFASYADETGTIFIVPLPVTRDGNIDLFIPTAPAMIAGATTGRAPALAHFDGQLVLAWRVSGPSGTIRIMRTPDGRAWPSGATASVLTFVDANGTASPAVIEDSAPFLHNSLGDLFLTSTTLLPTTTGAGNAPRIRVHRSGNALTFGEVAFFPVSDALLEGAAAAGPAAELVVLYPTAGRISTTLFGPGVTEREITTSTGRRVTVAHGP